MKKELGNAQQVKRAKWLRRAVEVLIFVALIAGVRAWQQRDVPAGAAPPINGMQVDGRNSPGPVLVQFWATWCPICRSEQDSIERLSRDHRIITVAMQSGSEEEVGRYLRREGLSFPVVNDPEGRIAAEWGVHAVPASFVVDKNGRIRFVEFGYTTKIGLRLRLFLAGLFA